MHVEHRNYRYAGQHRADQYPRAELAHFHMSAFDNRAHHRIVYRVPNAPGYTYQQTDGSKLRNGQRHAELNVGEQKRRNELVGHISTYAGYTEQPLVFVKQAILCGQRSLCNFFCHGRIFSRIYFVRLAPRTTVIYFQLVEFVHCFAKIVSFLFLTSKISKF